MLCHFCSSFKNYLFLSHFAINFFINSGIACFKLAYVLGGVYANVFSEKQSAVAFKGNTQAAPYFGAGINFQLNWLERGKAEDAYWEYGLENTYLYVEGRQFVSSGSAQDPDFGTSFQLAAGAKVEY